MTGKGKTLLFSNYLVPEGTRLALLERIFPELDKKKQINLITETLKEDWNFLEEGEVIILLNVLEKVFGEDKIAFRQQIYEIYFVPSCVAEKGTLAKLVELKLSILDKILYGWSWIDALGRQDIDAEECFKFVCAVYNSILFQDEKLKKQILNLLRKHLTVGWEATALTPWITHTRTPEDIVLVLLKARTRIGEARRGIAEIAFLDPFDLLNRSEEAIGLVVKYMKKVRQTDEVTRKLMERIRPCDREGASNRDAVFSSGRVSYHLVSEKMALVKLEFEPSKYQKADKYPEIIKEVQEIRDSLLSKVENSLTILIEAEGPDGFKYKE